MRFLLIFALILVTGSGIATAQSALQKKQTAPAAAPAAKPKAKAKAPAKKAAPKPEPEAELVEAETGENPLNASFQDFCKSWQGKLADREVRNKTMIKWDTGSNWVQGTYVGFAPEAKCTVEGRGATAIGKIVYLEVKYEKRGATIDEAQNLAPHAVETTEVTEIFRYEKGEWIY